MEDTTPAGPSANEPETPAASVKKAARKTTSKASEAVPAVKKVTAKKAAGAKTTAKKAGQKKTAAPVVAPAPVAEPRPEAAVEDTPTTPEDFEAQREAALSKLKPTVDETPSPTSDPDPETTPAPVVEDFEAQREAALSKLKPTVDETPSSTSDPAPAPKPTAEPAPAPEKPAQPPTVKKTPSQRRSGAWINLPGDSGESEGTEVKPIPVSMETLGAVGEGAHWNPHSVLGAHVGEGGVTVRTLRPFAQAVSVVTGSSDNPVHTPMTHEAHGVWVAVLPGESVADYRISVRFPGGVDTIVDDPYRFMPTLGEMDLYLIGEGRHEELWNVLGSHVKNYTGGPFGDVEGVSFAVWAPNARAVRVACDENHWDGRAHQLRSLGSSGVWEIFVPGMKAGSAYKYQILGRDGGWREKADPMARYAEIPPRTASVVVESHYEWNDSEWMTARPSKKPIQEAMSTYELHLGSWRPGLGYRELAEELVDYVTTAGFTHVEFMPLAEHPFGGSWGYQVTGYYAPTSRFGHPDDLKYLIDKLHQAGVAVIMDWVPAHFPKDEWALARFDGEPLYEHPDWRRGEHPDWGTYVFDFGRTEVRNFLVANAAYWLEEFHMDGLRVDAVASMLYLDYSREDGQWAPNQYGGREHLEAIDFLQEFNATSYKRVPGIVTIAEESTAWPGVTKPTHVGGLGFGFKWNMGWMHDSLGYVEKEPIYRQYHHHEMTFSMVYAFSENYVLPISHDEVVHGKGSLLRKMPGDRWQQVANLRCYLAFMWAHPGKKLLFMGQEFGQEAEWNEERGLDWWLLDQPLHSGALALVGDLNRLYTSQRALHQLDNEPGGFEWIDGNDSLRNLFSFIRKDSDGNEIIVVANFAGHPYEDFRLALPGAGEWEEVLNTDDLKYGGSGVVNTGTIHSEEIPWTGREHSAMVRIPPLGATFLKRRA